MWLPTKETVCLALVAQSCMLELAGIRYFQDYYKYIASNTSIAHSLLSETSVTLGDSRPSEKLQKSGLSFVSLSLV